MNGLAALDLNLLVVLDAILETGSVTAAARELHLTQSAVSNALGRLRHALGDPLLVRAGRKLVPTPRCEQLAPAVRGALAGLEGALQGGEVDLQKVERRFSLACADNHAIEGAAALRRELAERMPRARLRVLSVDQARVAGGLEAGEVDAMIAPAGAMPAMPSMDLYRETGALLVRDGFPVGRRMSRELFNRLDHIEVQVAGSSSLGHAAAVAAMQRHGLEWRPAMTVPHFTAAAVVAATSDCVAAVPRRFAQAVASWLPVRVLALPAPAFRLTIALFWHPRTGADAASQAFRDAVRRAFPRRPL